MAGQTLLERARLGERLVGEFIFDVHAHMGEHGPFHIPRPSAAGMIEVMDRVGIDVAAPAHHQACLSPDFAYGNDEVMAAQEQHPGRIAGYIGLFPHVPEGTVAELERCSAQGLRAVKMHSGQGKPYEAPEYEAAWEWVNDRGYPTLLHTWGDLAEIEKLADRYRNVPLLLAHSGVTNIDGYCRAAQEHDNIFLDIACSKCGNGLVAEFVRRVGSRKVLWGSDMPFLNAVQQIGRVLFAKISDDDKRAVLGGNARRLFGWTD